MEPDFRFPWSTYKHDDFGSESVSFSGGFRLYVVRTDRANPRKRLRYWRVSWYPAFDGSVEPKDHKEVPESEMPGLTDKKFRTKNQAKKAAEKIFVPVSKIAIDMVTTKSETRTWCSVYDPEHR